MKHLLHRGHCLRADADGAPTFQADGSGTVSSVSLGKIPVSLMTYFLEFLSPCPFVSAGMQEFAGKAYVIPQTYCWKCYQTPCVVLGIFYNDDSSSAADIQGIYFYPIFIDEKTGPEKFRNVPRVMQLVQRCWTVRFQSCLLPALIPSWF